MVRNKRNQVRSSTPEIIEMEGNIAHMTSTPQRYDYRNGHDGALVNNLKVLQDKAVYKY